MNFALKIGIFATFLLSQRKLENALKTGFFDFTAHIRENQCFFAISDVCE